ncbi:MAG TPA: carbamoyltransferase C-terminal domain-containing protein [Gallionella sp.]|nr:carbamoyltransferase C-terminal domain-containing protein [Gallionella sp.]
MSSIIAVNDGHNASCVHLEKGEVRFALQEERLSRVKNQGGFPALSLAHLAESVNLAGLDAFVFATHYVPLSPHGREDRMRAYKRGGLVAGVKQFAKRLGAKRARAAYLKQQRVAHAVALGVPPEKISFKDHHLCHAASAYYGWGRLDEPVLVLTNDGAGDDLCATVSIGQGGKLERIAAVHMNHSIGELWALFTAMMGMVPLEHEYKLMGLAPYAPPEGAGRVKKMLDAHFSFTPDGLGWSVNPGKPAIPQAYGYFRDATEFMRFDWVAGGLQAFTEEFLCRWVSNAIRKTSIRKVALAGGTFMNVKANKRIGELEEVEDLFIFPSCGDETLPFGAAYDAHAAMGGTCEPLGHLYLGMQYDSAQVKAAFDGYGFRHECRIRKCERISDEVAALLAQGRVVAWFQGREEFGARALGARSLVADASRPGVVEEINGMIKSRDFWMPFAASMTQEGAQRYLRNPGNSASPYMIMTFDTTEAAGEIEGGRHPYDRTCRPQVVSREWNGRYHELLTAFAGLTGRQGILNTSLNLHGLPIASSPQDAFQVLDDSGLRFLAIEDWLVEKVGSRAP